MNIGNYYQILVGLTRESNRFSYPRSLKELVRTGDLDDVKQLEDVLADEIANVSLHENNGAEYFAFLAESALLFALSRDAFDAFDGLADVVEKRLGGLKGAGSVGIDIAGWQWYFGYLQSAAARLKRQSTIETFEREIDDIEWDEIGSEFIYKVSSITGFVYLNESNPDKKNKARFWLQKAVSEKEIAYTLVAMLNLADFYLGDEKAENQKRIEDLIAKLEGHASAATDQGLGRIYRAAVLDYQARALIFKSGGHDDDIVKIEENLRTVREVEKNVSYDSKNTPSFVRAYLKLLFSNYYLSINSDELDKDDLEDLMAMAMEDINEALSIARRMKDTPLKNQFRIEWMSVAARRQTKISEKELKEVLNEVKKSSNYRGYVRAAVAYAYFYQQNGDTQKAYDLLMEMVRKGYKKVDAGGFFLVTNGLGAINTIFLNEVEQPGISWMVNSLHDFFAHVADMINGMEDHITEIGQELFESFMTEFIRLEPATHFNIKVYLQFQYFEMKMLRLAAIARGDKLAQKLSDTLLKEISSDNSPLSFMQADWDEFKDVPNSVRNKVLNKCISISKGDLPLAAEHLDFSYRNLRSYITFKEVNRLGFFLDEKQTANKLLENGIRLMFFDLYKRGTIFEVVFDMPKFLVEHAKRGFSSQDLEEALDIKGTTAKKYIKIMMDVGIIKLERSVGRKHFYKLRKDVIMNRLGKETTVMT